ncbi:peroxiredoxin [Flavobacteriales bacterium]|jgi:peroxiredoxin (alkyl hydroperoxide reductase subunit C)|nr:peroxiredoxin [Flavobacteriales bacterium]MDA7578644.1 peroxiredoxin [Flavobacteriales bacterium]MDC0908907.1 peroxiredoxin [Flavobacteriales bacterium]MDC1069279.1 peroxiredoxin [Flavobacteriales bacterium]MDC3389909.1 peroxiredoxin [Flavobacteriales bacterium]|tara:strand:- start:262 stop:894 length:633 start_codon:yes stop_codon:yes gene_type:complete
MSVLVGKKAPNFSAQAVVNGGEFVSNYTLEQFIGKKPVLLFFYPKDFTFVCPTELFAFQNALSEFESRNCAVVACSTDTEQSHWGWLQMPKNEGGIKGITYPIIADTSKTIAENFGVLAGDYELDENDNMCATGPMIAYRGLFLIDKSGTVQHQIVNNFPLGRNVDEALRMVDALQHFEENGEVCPANWSKGKESMKESHDSVANYLANN